MKKSKKYEAAAKKVDNKKIYSLEEAAKLLPEISTSSFAGTIEALVTLNLTEKQKKETIRGSYVLPNKFGKEPKVLAFIDKSEKASKADISGGEELIEKVEKGEVDFDIVIATPAMMPKIARLGKTLGTKGLMPNPKNGTVTQDPDTAIDKVKSGMRNFKMNDAGLISGVVGKTDMTEAQMIENITEFMKAISTETKKLGVNVISKVTLSPTMGPSLKVEVIE